VQPSSETLEAAIGPVMSTAKQCVRGASDVSRARLVFLPSGGVEHIEVTGWAAANGASECVVAALKGLNVGPFSNASFSVGLTLRP
jgi:hypothetical protein